MARDDPRMPAEPEPCVFCGAPEGVLRSGGGGAPSCIVCGWALGDSPDADLPRPRVEVVYYLRWEQRVKIGTSSQPRQRLAAIWHQELLAFERGGRMLERERHAQFADLREGGEWFRADPVLLAHARALAGDRDPWHSYARWLAEAFRSVTT
ncbi:hypothetical protein JOD63_002987 [Microbacterium terrae]|nr:GIY-YIG nuclease family protein [Microbacterium terrae]MBP1079019.1 hypothetical protein [Microbacterium terrae]